MPKLEVKHSEGRDFYDDCYESVANIETSLDFSACKFYGRQEELKMLHCIHRSVCKNAEPGDNIKEIVPITVIHGYSGTGKSTLMHQFMDEVKKNESETKQLKQRCFCITGKYDQMNGSDPLSAIVEAFGMLATELLNGETEEFETLRGEICSQIGGEARSVLASVIPDLKRIFLDVGSETIRKTDFEPAASSRTSLKTSSMKYAIQAFLKIICSHEHPLVMFLDDIQWIDQASLDLITNLLTDTSLSNFMFVGGVRANEFDNKDYFVMKQLEIIKKTRHVEQIHLLNFSIDEIGQFLGDMLNLEIDEAMPLTKVVYDKTRGNIFFTMQMLEELERRNLLFYSVINFQWEWDLNQINTTEDLSDNVVDAVVGKMKSTPEVIQKIFSVASLVRYTVDSKTLEIMMEAIGYPVQHKELIKLLDLGVLEGMLSNVVGSSSYRFAHDRIREAAYSLVGPGEERDLLREKIGKRLFQYSSSADDQEWMLYIAAEHLNSISLPKTDLILITTLNLEVGEKACAVAAFAPASDYLTKALNSLKEIGDHWQKHYDLSLRIYRALTIVKLKLGHFDAGHELGQHVLDHAKSYKDKIPIYMSLVLALDRQERYKEAIALNWVALHLLGEKRKPYKYLSLMIDLQRANLFFKKYSDEDILNLPSMADETKLTIMKFFDEASHQAYACRKYSEFMLITLRKLRMSYKYGICGSTALSLAQYAMYIGSNGDQKNALRLTKLAKDLLVITDSKTVEAQTLFYITHYTEGWSNLPAESIGLYRCAEKSGMETGDFNFGFRSWLMSIHSAFMAGHHLNAVLSAGEKLSEQLRLYKDDSNFSRLGQMQLPVLYLSGKSDTPLDWQKLKKENIIEQVQATASSDSFTQIDALLDGCLARMTLAVYFGENQMALGWVEQAKKYSNHDTVAESVLLRVFYSGLIYSALARKSGSKKYYYLAKKEAIEMKRLVITRGVKSAHRHAIMEADLMTFSVKKQHKNDKISKAYGSAINLAANAGFIQDAALGCERAGQYFVSVGEKALSQKYMAEARVLYLKWGATAKVEHLKEQWAGCLEDLTDVSVTSDDKFMGINISSYSRFAADDVDLSEVAVPRTKFTASTMSSHISTQSLDKW